MKFWRIHVQPPYRGMPGGASVETRLRRPTYLRMAADPTLARDEIAVSCTASDMVGPGDLRRWREMLDEEERTLGPFSFRANGERR